MGKPKENTIAKIDILAKKRRKSDLSREKKELITALANRCHSMNIHKAKLVYFKEIKLLLTKCLVSFESGEIGNESCWQSLEKDLLGLLYAKNG
ncbi:hypothetical protein JWJ90_02425 [Desulfobulbus rhabdoformis]|jgi:hypothetical protein|uniref:hypothetical protein n=1 Tax=Desulfobulbus rhabdoformis TaxID=34032 RepID=UPI001964D001|nr:hypothetical protein [Desulfobulbus rhabdoformis]MBM9613136.1 hypothetical protein [Desulfobulbus rhabdoformis]